MKIANGESCFYQWEWDQQLELPFPCAAVYFENGTQSEAPGCKVKEVGGKWLCDVPNDLLQTAADLHAFAWDEEKTHVVGYAVFTVIPRAKPANYVYTQTEVWTAEKAVAEALEKAKASGEFKGEKGEKGDPQDAVCYDTDQSLSDEQQAQARENIGIDGAILGALVDLCIAPVLLDADGSVLVDGDNAVLINV